jgi:hypothetical protein
MINDLTPQEYDKLLERAKGLVFDKPHIDAEDLVSDIVLEFLEKEKPLHLHELIKGLQFKVNKYRVNLKNGRQHLSGHTISKSDQSRVCTCCKQPIPISGFYVVSRNLAGEDVHGVVKEVLAYCIPCQRIKSAEQAKRNRNRPEKIEARKRAQRKYQAKKRKSMTLAEKRAYNEKMKAYRQTPQWKEYVKKRA